MNPNDNFPDLKAANPVEMQPTPEPIIPDGEVQIRPHRQADWFNPCKKIAHESKKRRKMAKQSRKINRRK